MDRIIIYFGDIKPFEGNIEITATYHNESRAKIFAGELSSLESVTVNGEALEISGTDGLYYDFTKHNDITVVYKFNKNLLFLDKAFANCKSLTHLDFSNFEKKDVSVKRMFEGLELEDGFASNVSFPCCDYLFSKFASTSEISLEVDQVYTKDTSSMNHMFDGCLIETISDFNMKNCTNADGIFDNCSNLNLIEITNIPDSDVFSGNVELKGLSKVGKLAIVTNTPNYDVKRIAGLVMAFRSLGWNVVDHNEEKIIL